MQCGYLVQLSVLAVHERAELVPDSVVVRLAATDAHSGFEGGDVEQASSFTWRDLTSS